MGFCSDRSVQYLKTLGLNVILHPEENIRPLMLLGEYRGSRAIIGTLDQLLEDATVPLPDIETSVASEINGERTSKLPASLGLDVLGALIGAAGVNIGVKATYENARTMRFTFENVVRERVNLVKVGDFLEGGDVLWEHIILKRYLFGKGNLYVLTEVVRSDKVTVEAYRKDKSSLEVELPVIDDALGGDLSVGHEGEGKAKVSYKGPKQLAFGFKAIELAAGGVGEDGEIDLVFRPVKDGAIFKSGTGVVQAREYDQEGALDTLGHADPAMLGAQ